MATLTIYGQPKTCMPCKMTEENLRIIKGKDIFDLTFEEVTDIEVIKEKKYTSIPVIELVTEGRTSILNDHSVLLDEDELQEWIEERLGEH